MFRSYAHLYHGHWLEPFYHLGIYRELNTSFVHFINVGKLHDLLEDNDIKPMKPLVDIWISKGLVVVKQPRQPQQVEPAPGRAPTATAAAAA